MTINRYVLSPTRTRGDNRVTETVILKGVPIPASGYKSRKPKYDISNLTAGEMLFVPGGKPGVKQTANKQAKALGFKVRVAPHEHEGMAGVGIWRLPKED